MPSPHVSRRPANDWFGFALKAAELAVAAPQVVAHRVTRMALAGPVPSARDRREFQGMVSEKTVAFGSAWTAMTLHAWRANQALALACWKTALSPAAWLPGAQAPAQALQRQVLAATLGVLGKGLAPVHAKAVANARRLSRLPRR